MRAGVAKEAAMRVGRAVVGRQEVLMEAGGAGLREAARRVGAGEAHWAEARMAAARVAPEAATRAGAADVAEVVRALGCCIRCLCIRCNTARMM